MTQSTSRDRAVLGHRASGPRLTRLGVALVVAVLSLPLWIAAAILAVTGT